MVLRRDGRTRTRDTQCWKLLFWPLNYTPIKTENRPLGVTLRAAPGLGLLIVAFVRRDPTSAREDLKAMLASLREPRPAFGLYFDCCARGAPFFGVSGLEAAYLEESFGGVPLLGLFGSCEIGPVASRTELLTYTGVLALVDS